MRFGAYSAVPDPPCQACERRLQYDALHRRWDVPRLSRHPYTHSSWPRCAWGPTQRPASYSAVSPVRPPICCERGAGGALSRDVLLEAVNGAERHAMRWALRDTGDGPLNPQRCRQAAQALFAAR